MFILFNWSIMKKNQNIYYNAIIITYARTNWNMLSNNSSIDNRI